MGRLPGFDYKKPYFYMVTLKRNDGYAPLSRIAGASGRVESNEITRLFTDIIMTFHETWYCLEPIRCFSIMPDHIHLLIKLREAEKVTSLAVIVRMLARKLEQAYFAVKGEVAFGEANAGKTPTRHRDGDGRCPAVDRFDGQHLFAFEWHDWIVKKGGQLKAFVRYIRENPKRAWQRERNRGYFSCVRKVEIKGREWQAYGNLALLDLPVIEPFQCSRKWAKDGKEWREALTRAERIGPGGAGIGTFMSPCEKECGNAIFKAGGGLIMLCPEGFGERWHPTRNKEALCAKGRMLFLTLYEPSAKKPDKATLYLRCHEMGDIFAKG